MIFVLALLLLSTTNHTGTRFIYFEQFVGIVYCVISYKNAFVVAFIVLRHFCYVHYGIVFLMLILVQRWYFS